MNGRAVLLTLSLAALPIALAHQAAPTPQVAAQAPKAGEVAGKGQIPGDTGQFGQTYTIEGNNTLINVTLTGAEWTVGHLIANDDDQIHPDRKILILHFT
ncbi:MAG TPA: hypothetical protein VHN99_08340, partial [Deinococcales bacterium]|nr:hypothetical protein [Deinococcales bacterium]